MESHENEKYLQRGRLQEKNKEKSTTVHRDRHLDVQIYLFPFSNTTNNRKVFSHIVLSFSRRSDRVGGSKIRRVFLISTTL